MSNYQIQRMVDSSEVQVALDAAEREGWEPGNHDAYCFFQADQQGFFKGLLDGKIIATGSAVCYDQDFAFCGLYIVVPEHRGKGYGMSLTQARLAYCGKRNIGIDGVLENVKIYQRIGYHPYYENARFCFESNIKPQPNNPAIVSISSVDFATLSAFDRKHFPSLREPFLKAWIYQDESLALAYVDNGELKGYGIIRTCRQAFKIGPLFAEEPEIAKELFFALAKFANGSRVYLDIPENNPNAIALVQSLSMNKIFATARMYMQSLPDLQYSQIYAITSYELG